MALITFLMGGWGHAAEAPEGTKTANNIPPSHGETTTIPSLPVSKSRADEPSSSPAEMLGTPRTPMTSMASLTPSMSLPKGDIPTELVGEWDGDGEGPARLTKIAFRADGTALLYQNTGQIHYGTAVVSGSSMVIHIPGGQMVVNHWSVETFEAGYGYVFENLILDGVSYVRQIKGG
ncbi:hypothetical protein [Streptomyces griseocarneus]|uniref:hypothetical protein n=1 Tax=Streptomyces griseocarneus TaxID=51201 RepID=UPI00167CFB0B|nr:hypothetical protein [Streptomyces griseocarneus]MBZ6475803.1 hypothetical protein [Streptomyces griseocarneus]